MDTRAYYAGKFLKAEHLDPDRDTVVEIVDVTVETVGDDDDDKKEQVCLQLKEFKQILGLNATNAKTLWDLFGYDSDDWMDQRVSLYVDPNIKFGSKTVEGIRIRPRKPPARATRGRKKTTSKKGSTSERGTRRRRAADGDGD